MLPGGGETAPVVSSRVTLCAVIVTEPPLVVRSIAVATNVRNALQLIGKWWIRKSESDDKRT